MAKEEAMPEVVLSTPGKKPVLNTPERIAERVAEVKVAPAAEGVQRLNEGFFRVEQMRVRPGAKLRGRSRQRVVGK